MSYYIIKIAITVILIILIAEIAKRSSVMGAILASIPLISVLALFWLYIDTKDIEKVSALATSIFWLVLPSLTLFILLPILLKQEINFYLSMAISITATIICYWIMLNILNYFAIK